MPLQSLTEPDQSLDQHPDVYQFHCALRGVYTRFSFQEAMLEVI